MFSDVNAAMVLAGLSAFAAIIGLALPDKQDRRLRTRLQSVARERDRLREKRLKELSSQTKRKLRKADSGRFARFARSFGTAERRQNSELGSRLIAAGFRGQSAVAVFSFLRIILPAGFAFTALLVLTLLPAAPLKLSTILGGSIAVGALGFVLPRLILDRMIARRQKTIMKHFPDALDLLLICVQSGMSVESALGKVTRDISPQCIELAEELSLTMAELSYLPLRWRAYANLGERTGLAAVKLITAALVQAERYGTSISQALTAAARECREIRIATAEHKAAALPPKLAAPLVVFFLPVLLTIILAPAIMSASDALERNRDKIISAEKQTPTHLRSAPSNPRRSLSNGW